MLNLVIDVYMYVISQAFISVLPCLVTANRHITMMKWDRLLIPRHQGGHVVITITHDYRPDYTYTVKQQGNSSPHTIYIVALLCRNNHIPSVFPPCTYTSTYIYINSCLASPYPTPCLSSPFLTCRLYIQSSNEDASLQVAYTSIWCPIVVLSMQPLLWKHWL